MKRSEVSSLLTSSSVTGNVLSLSVSEVAVNFKSVSNSIFFKFNFFADCYPRGKDPPLFSMTTVLFFSVFLNEFRFLKTAESILLV